MTPLIKDVVKTLQVVDYDLADHQLFDMTGLVLEEIDQQNYWLGNALPPFPKCIFALDVKDHKVWMVVFALKTSVVVITYRLYQNHYDKLPTFSYEVNDKTGEITVLGQASIKDRDMCLQLLAGFYKQLAQRSTTVYTPTPHKANISRAKRGLRPLYEWTTVLIEPVKPKAEYKGGTHASPRLHDRRGHMRKTKTGKQIWVKSCKVGNANKGTIFHDYKIKTTS